MTKVGRRHSTDRKYGDNMGEVIQEGISRHNFSLADTIFLYKLFHGIVWGIKGDN